MEQFYHQTSGNIARINSHLTDFFTPIEPKRSYVGRLSFATVVLLVIVINSTYWWYEQNKREQSEGSAARAQLLQELDEASSSNERAKRLLEKRLISQILPYNVASVHLSVEPAPLKSVSVDALGEEDSFQDNLVVMDKVPVFAHHPLTQTL